MGDKDYHKNNNITSEDSLKRETENWSCLQLNRRDKDSNIQLSDAIPKKSRQDCFTKSISGTRQSIHIKDKTLASANIMHLIFAISSVSKSHKYMLTVLANFNTRCDDSGPDELFLLKKAMASLYLKDFKKTMQAKF